MGYQSDFVGLVDLRNLYASIRSLLDEYPTVPVSRASFTKILADLLSTENIDRSISAVVEADPALHP